MPWRVNHLQQNRKIPGTVLEDDPRASFRLWRVEEGGLIVRKHRSDAVHAGYDTGRLAMLSMLGRVICAVTACCSAVYVAEL